MSQSLAITWLGHSTFLLRLPSGRRVAVDPWLDNPQCPPAWRARDLIGPEDGILLSHGHGDHIGSVVGVARATGASVVCAFELAHHLRRLGVLNVIDMGIGGTVALGDLSISMTAATHSSSAFVDGRIEYLGAAAGYVLRAPGMPAAYFAGDTGLFGDMRVIGERYRPAIAFLPIGDRYTMGPEDAAEAARWLKVRQVVPMHWGTSPGLTGTPAALEAALAGSGIEVLTLAPGDTAE